jgi:hypothetical protein
LRAAIALRPGLKVLYTSSYTDSAIVPYGRLDPGVTSWRSEILTTSITSSARQ